MTPEMFSTPPYKPNAPMLTRADTVPVELVIPESVEGSTLGPLTCSVHGTFACIGMVANDAQN